jgi:hypothetical protein
MRHRLNGDLNRELGNLCEDFGPKSTKAQTDEQHDDGNWQR